MQGRCDRLIRGSPLHAARTERGDASRGALRQFCGPIVRFEPSVRNFAPVSNFVVGGHSHAALPSCVLVRGIALIILQPRQLVGVEIAVAKQFLADPRALHEKADVELVGHAHAAMHLHAFLHRQRRG